MTWRMTLSDRNHHYLWPPNARPLYFTAVFFFFISSAEMKDQPWDLNQTWPVGRKWCRFTNAPNISGALPKNLERKNIKFWTTFSATFALYTAYLRNETSHRQTKMLVSIYNVGLSRTNLPSLDPFAYCDSTFGGHYVATFKVATCQVLNYGSSFLCVERMKLKSWN